MREDFQNARSRKHSPTSQRLAKKAQLARDRALHDAVSLNRTEKIPALMQAGANPARLMLGCVKDSCGRRRKTTALHLAVSENRLEALCHIVAHAPLLDAPDLHGQTALHLAVKAGRLRMVEILLNAGAARDVKSAGGKTPLEMIDATIPSGTADEIVRLFNAAEGRDCRNRVQTDQRIHVRPPLQIKKPGPDKP